MSTGLSQWERAYFIVGVGLITAGLIAIDWRWLLVVAGAVFLKVSYDMWEQRQ